MLSSSDFAIGDASIQSTIFGLSRSYIQIWYDITVDGDKLSDLETFRICEFFSIQFPMLRKMKFVDQQSNIFIEFVTMRFPE